jgi:hypothetical protein
MSGYGRRPSSGKRRYVTFHGHGPQGTGQVDFPEPQELICLGDAVSIVYRCAKYNGGGDGQMALYEHKFARGAKLFTDETGRCWLHIHGPRIKVEEPGIIN